MFCLVQKINKYNVRGVQMFKMAEDSLFLETLSLTSVDEGFIATIEACIIKRSVRKSEPILLSFYNNN